MNLVRSISGETGTKRGQEAGAGQDLLPHLAGSLTSTLPGKRSETRSLWHLYRLPKVISEKSGSSPGEMGLFTPHFGKDFWQMLYSAPVLSRSPWPLTAGFRPRPTPPTAFTAGRRSRPSARGWTDSSTGELVMTSPDQHLATRTLGCHWWRVWRIGPIEPNPGVAPLCPRLKPFCLWGKGGASVASSDLGVNGLAAFRVGG
jgi:hypothetical protein